MTAPRWDPADAQFGRKLEDLLAKINKTMERWEGVGNHPVPPGTPAPALTPVPEPCPVPEPTPRFPEWYRPGRLLEVVRPPLLPEGARPLLLPEGDRPLPGLPPEEIGRAHV